jgi:hypothetical protein
MPSAWNETDFRRGPPRAYDEPVPDGGMWHRVGRPTRIEPLPWVLEVCLEEHDPDDGLPSRRHLGYMKKIFRTRKEACEYYNTHNPHLRSINAHGTYKSDWDPVNHKFYIVRKFHCIKMTIPPFSGSSSG